VGTRVVGYAWCFLRERDQVSLHCQIEGDALANTCRSWIHAITRKLKSKPLLDIAGGVIEDYEFLWDQYYFSTTTL
jgi:hypothetical protein